MQSPSLMLKFVKLMLYTCSRMVSAMKIISITAFIKVCSCIYCEINIYGSLNTQQVKSTVYICKFFGNCIYREFTLYLWSSVLI